MDRKQARNRISRRLSAASICLAILFFMTCGPAGAADPDPVPPEDGLPPLSPMDELPPLSSPDAPPEAIQPEVIKENGRTYYIVQSGDTLWSISQKFLDSPYYWPDLWKVNADVPITNPHLIYPGQRIRLFQKGELMAGGPRSLETPASATAMDAPMTPPEAGALETEMPDLGEIGEMPAMSMPDIAQDGDYVYPSIARVGFLRSREEPPLGEIFKVRDNKVLISKGDTVYIRQMGEEPLEISKKYILYRTYKPLVDKETGAGYGVQHMLTGVVEIVDIMPDFVIGQINDGYRPISVKDRLMPYFVRTPVITPVSPVQGLTGRLIVSEDRSYLLGEHSVAFLNKGENDGMKVGQVYDLFTMNNVKTGQDGHRGIYSEVDISVGSVLVLHTEPETATSVVIRSQRSFRAGVGFRSRY